MTRTIPILLYHSIAGDVAPKFRTWAVPREIFAAQMSYLLQNHYTPLTVTQLAEALADPAISLPERPVVITFDDGLADFYSGALPTLAEHRFSATLYVTTGLVGRSARWLAPLDEGNRPMLTWSRISEICAAGVECGGHSVSHPQLDIVSHGAAQREIADCKIQLEQHLGRAVKTFAYPHGYYSRAVRAMVRDTGYTSACGVKHAMSTTDDDRFALARLIVTAENGRDQEHFASLLTGQGLPIAPTKRGLLTVGWRLARRHATLFARRPAEAAGSATTATSVDRHDP